MESQTSVGQNIGHPFFLFFHFFFLSFLKCGSAAIIGNFSRFRFGAVLQLEAPELVFLFRYSSNQNLNST